MLAGHTHMLVHAMHAKEILLMCQSHHGMPPGQMSNEVAVLVRGPAANLCCELAAMNRVTDGCGRHFAPPCQVHVTYTSSAYIAKFLCKANCCESCELRRALLLLQTLG